MFSGGMGFSDTTGDLARRLSVTPGRISQLVRDGSLSECYSGDGRARRFDPRLVAERLNRVLDPGQSLGNGADASRARQKILADGGERGIAGGQLIGDSALPEDDPDGYQLARTEKVQAEARRLKRQLALEEGTAVLREKVEAEIVRAMQSELANLETALRDTSRVIADRFGVDAAEVRAVLRDELRDYRRRRVGELSETSAAIETEGLPEDEAAHDV